MEQIKLDVQVRNQLGSQRMKDLRKTGAIPAVVYGGGAEPVSVQVARSEFERILRQHEGESILFHIQVKDNGKAVIDFPALVRDLQYHPVSDLIDHVDFQRISLDKEISIKVPVTLKGDAIGLKKPGATLEHLMRELEVVCLPKNIPQHIEVDVSNLDVLSSVHLSDIKLPEGVKTKVDEGAVIVTIVFATREEAPAAAEGAAPAEVEVIKEKPKEGAEGAAAPAAGAKPAAAAAKPEAKK